MQTDCQNTETIFDSNVCEIYWYTISTTFKPGYKGTLGILSWLVIFGLTAQYDRISVYIGLSHRDRAKEERNNR